MQSETPYVHAFENEYSQIERPSSFTFPFCYEPHPLSILAAEQVQKYLKTQVEFMHNFGLENSNSGVATGKMFGVLVVENLDKKLGFLAACSGKLAGTNQHQYFVPPIFDMLNPQGFFLLEEEVINDLNRRIKTLEGSQKIRDKKLQLQNIQIQNSHNLSKLKEHHKTNKNLRKQLRLGQKEILSEVDYQLFEKDLIKQSYRDQHEFQVARENANAETQKIEFQLNEYISEINQLKTERKQRSTSLQNKLFDQYHFLNSKSESKSVLSIFNNLNIIPPAGAGECAAPKLLQYAFQNQLKPICMAEFWWGISPNLQVRKHQNFYPACRSKCEPILNHMLEGLTLDPNPLLENTAQGKNLNIIYDDQSIIVVNKPAEFLSVPGIHIKDSVQTRILLRYPDITGPLIIHRLDMSTSGILILAKNKAAHQFIQDQFIKRTVVKRYTAILEGVISEEEGIIDLPLRVDLDNRPRQVVCYEYGKNARTKFKVIGVENNNTRIHFYPLTGRTHQLRVHSAHYKGLNSPIIGDDLYGTRANRLHLHAGYIEFIHPESGQKISFEVQDPF